MEDMVKVYDIAFDTEIDCVVMEWNGYATSRQFKEGTELMLNTLLHHKASKVLANIKDMTLIGKEDQDWLDSDFLPRATRFGFKAIAIIKPHHYFNKVAVESISYKVDKEKLLINFFENVEDARDWLSGIEV